SRERGAARRIHAAFPVAERRSGAGAGYAVAVRDARVRAAAPVAPVPTDAATVSVRSGEFGARHGRAARARCAASSGTCTRRRSAGDAAAARLRVAASVSNGTAAGVERFGTLLHAGAGGDPGFTPRACSGGATVRARSANASAAGPVRPAGGASAHSQRLHAHPGRSVGSARSARHTTCRCASRRRPGRAAGQVVQSAAHYRAERRGAGRDRAGALPGAEEIACPAPNCRGDAHRAFGGSTTTSSICGFGKSAGTYAARLRARTIASHSAPDFPDRKSVV